MINQIVDRYPDEQLIIADGFDDAVIGIDTKQMRVVYSITKCIDILCRQMEEDEAVEYFDFNVAGSYVGDRGPIFVDDDFDRVI